MADDVNKSNKPPMNGFGISEIEKIGASAYSIPKSEQEQRIRATTARTQMNALQDLPDSYVLNSPALTRVAQNAPNTLMSAEQRIRGSVSSRLERSNLQAVNAIGREYSETAINSMSRSMYDSPVYQNRALSMMGSSYEDLAQRRSAISGQLNALGSSSTEAASGLFTTRGPRGDLYNQISGNAKQANSLVQEMTSIDLAMKTRRQTGSDPLSRFERLNTMGKSAEDFLSAKQIGQELSAGGININRGGQSVQVANADIGKALAQEADNLKRALTELATSAGKSAEELNVMRQKAEESAENFDKLQKAQTGGGGSWGASGAQWAAAGAGMFNAIGGGIQQIAVTQRLGQVGNIAGYAGIENQKYNMYRSGRGGDVMSQMLASQWGEAEGFGKELKTGQQYAVGAYAAGGALQATAGGFQIAGSLNPVENVVGTSSAMSARIQGAQNLTQGLTTTAVNTMDLTRGVSTNAAAIQGTSISMEARKALLSVSAEQLQGFRDFGVGMSTAAMGMGKRGGAFIDEATSTAGLGAMANSRISPEQMAVMSQQGVATMGSMFSTGQIHAARGLERSGMGSMSENMQRMATLAGAGSNNPQAGLGSVMEAAVSRGLDSSKAVSMMVENTAAIVSASGASTAAGINTVATTAALLGGNVDPNQKNQEFAVQRAATAQQIARDTVTDTSVSFTGMINTSRISKTTGLSGTRSIFAAGLTPEEIRGLQAMKDPAAQSEALLKRGINISGVAGGINGFLSTMLENQTSQMFTGNGALGLGNNAIRDSITKSAIAGKSWDQLSPEEKELAGQLGARTGLAGDEYFRSAAGFKNAENKPNSVTTVNNDMSGEGGSDTAKTWDNLRTSGFKQLTEQAFQATKTMENFGGALKVLVDMNDKLEKFGAGGAEGKFAEAAADAASTFGEKVVNFGEHVEMFGQIINKSGLSRSDDVGQREVNKLINQQERSKDQKFPQRVRGI